MTDSNFNINRQPKEVIFCKKCVLSNQVCVPSKLNSDDANHTNRKFLTIDENGICSACNVVSKKYKKDERSIDWAKRERELNEILDKYRSRNGSFDCIVPGSGGKDSVFQAYILKHKYKMNPLTVTFSPQLYSDIGMKNFHNWAEKGNVNNFLFSPSGEVYGKLARLAFEKMLHPFQPFIFGQRHYASHLAIKFKIPLIFWGESNEEYGADQEEEGKYYYQKDFWTKRKGENVLLAGCNEDQLINEHKFKYSDLQYFLPADIDLITKNDVQILWLGYFERFQPQENYYKATELTGFRANPERTAGTYSKYLSIDDKTDGFHYWTSYIKFGVGRTTHESAEECRNGYITRDEAIKLVKKYDGEFPKKYFKDFLNFTKLSEEEFFEIVDRFRPSHLWKKEGNDFRYGNNWKLKKTIY